MRVMRLLIMFDLPTKTQSDKKSYHEFHKFLVNSGWIMEQFSVYSRITLGTENANSHLSRVNKNLPPKGCVTVLELTEKQYTGRKILINSTKRGVLSYNSSQLSLEF